MVIINHLRDVAQPDLLEVDEQADAVDGDEYRAAIQVAGRVMVRMAARAPVEAAGPQATAACGCTLSSMLAIWRTCNSLSWSSFLRAPP